MRKTFDTQTIIFRSIRPGRDRIFDYIPQDTCAIFAYFRPKASNMRAIIFRRLSKRQLVYFETWAFPIFACLPGLTLNILAGIRSRLRMQRVPHYIFTIVDNYGWYTNAINTYLTSIKAFHLWAVFMWMLKRSVRESWAYASLAFSIPAHLPRLAQTITTLPRSILNRQLV